MWKEVGEKTDEKWDKEESNIESWGHSPQQQNQKDIDGKD